VSQEGEKSVCEVAYRNERRMDRSDNRGTSTRNSKPVGVGER
jgi:hypothetical protein